MRGSRKLGTSEVDLDKLLVDGIRGIMGLPPLYEPEGRPTNAERFGETRQGWWRQDGRIGAGRAHE